MIRTILYEAAFRENEINEKVLPSLTAEDLKDLGVVIVGHRRMLLDAIEILRPAPFEDLGNPKPEELIFYGKVSYGLEDGRARHQKVVDAALALIEQVRRRKWLRSGEEAIVFCRHLAAAMLYGNPVELRHDQGHQAEPSE